MSKDDTGGTPLGSPLPRPVPGAPPPRRLASAATALAALIGGNTLLAVGFYLFALSLSSEERPDCPFICDDQSGALLGLVWYGPSVFLFDLVVGMIVAGVCTLLRVRSRLGMSFAALASGPILGLVMFWTFTGSWPALS